MDGLQHLTMAELRAAFDGHDYPSAPTDEVRQHPLSNCGPLMLDLPEGYPCPTCGVPAGTEPSAETLAEIRELWPTYPQGFWR